MRRRTAWSLMAVGIGLLMILFGCAVSQATKGLNRQSGKAGALVERDQKAASETRQAGKDIRENSAAMEKELGCPSVDQDYTPENSKKLRDEVPDKPWYMRLLDNVWTVLGSAVTGGGLMNLAGRFLPALAGPWGGIASTLIGAIAKGRERAEKEKEGPAAIKALLTTLESELVDDGWQGKVKALAKAFEDDQEINHKVTLR